MSLKRAPTGWGFDEPAKAVQDFMNNYSIEHYKALAERAEQKLKKALEKEKNHLHPWTTTSRAKTKERLREKLIKRNEKKGFLTQEAIREDLWDLAGVRVILYFASEEEHEKIQSVIERIWAPWGKVARHEHPRPKENEPTTPGKKRSRGTPRRTNSEHSITEEVTEPSGKGEVSKAHPKKYQPRHMGYRAIHYICKMNKHADNADYSFAPGDQVEIQVVSALTHVWATAGHDLLYKSSIFGKSNTEELRVFDALNGIIQSGDLLLEQFQWMVHGRTYRKFEDSHDLAAYLRKADVLQHLPKQSQSEPDSVDNHLEILLLEVLRQAEKDCPFEVREALKRLGYPGDVHSHKGNSRFDTHFNRDEQLPLSLLLIADNLPVDYKSQDFKDLTSDRLCYIMMSALKLLQILFGLPEKANEYLQQLPLQPEERTSINVVLSSGDRQFMLMKEGHEEKDKARLRRAWIWFQEQASKNAENAKKAAVAEGSEEQEIEDDDDLAEDADSINSLESAEAEKRPENEQIPQITNTPKEPKSPEKEEDERTLDSICGLVFRVAEMQPLKPIEELRCKQLLDALQIDALLEPRNDSTNA